MNHVSAGRSVGPLAPSIEVLARWWTSASQGERFQLVKRTIEGDPEAPPFGTLRIAIYLAEAEAGEISG